MEPLISRSLHTQPLDSRAARRIARPYTSRRMEATVLSGRTPQMASIALFRQHFAPPAPRIFVQKPLPGLLCPLEAGDIRAFLKRLGPAAVYGLRVIHLRQECRLHSAGLWFAEYVVPNEIHLYAVPASPWRLAFVPHRFDREAFQRHGAIVTIDESRQETTLCWQPDGLKSFLLVEVLAHEIGHHVLQHNKGKRRAQICRRADHEACADQYSRRTYRQQFSDGVE